MSQYETYILCPNLHYFLLEPISVSIYGKQGVRSHGTHIFVTEQNEETNKREQKLYRLL